MTSNNELLLLSLLGLWLCLIKADIEIPISIGDARRYWYETETRVTQPPAPPKAKRDLGNVCSMRIVVDQFIMKEKKMDRSVMGLEVSSHIDALNYIYEKNVRFRGRKLKFKLKYLEFRDEAWCTKNPSSASCKEYWGTTTSGEFLDLLKDQEDGKHNDVCLVFYFISHKFKASKAIGLAYVGRICQRANQGFVLFNDATNNDRQGGVETKFVFAHEVGHALGLYHDGPGSPGTEDHEFTKIGEKCSAKGGNLMAPESDWDFDKTNVELSECSKEMFERLPKKESDWSCLVLEEEFAQKSYDTVFLAGGLVMAFLVLVIVALCVIICYPKDLLAPCCPQTNRLGRTYTKVRRHASTARMSMRRSTGLFSPPPRNDSNQFRSGQSRLEVPGGSPSPSKPRPPIVPGANKWNNPESSPGNRSPGKPRPIVPGNKSPARFAPPKPTPKGKWPPV